MMREPDHERCQHHSSDSNSDPRCRRTEIGDALPVSDSHDCQSGEQEHRPVLAIHCQRGGDAGQHRINILVRVERADERPGGKAPKRDRHTVGVVLESVNVEERHQRQYCKADDALFRRQVTPRQPPGEPEADARHGHGQQVEGPVRLREHAEPQAGNPAREGRMLRSRDQTSASAMSQ